MALGGSGTVDDLLSDARRLGHQASRRMITDWVALGLLDSPTRRGVGRGQGTTKGVYSAHQRELFSTLLLQRTRSTRVAHLTAVPVGLWLYWGDGYVPLRQVRRALDTWIGAAGKTVEARSRLSTQQLLKQLAAPEATETARVRLQRLLDEANIAGQVRDSNELEQALTQVFDPNSVGRTLGPPGARISPVAIVQTAVLKARAINALSLHQVPDSIFERARTYLQHSLSEYVRSRPQLLAEAEESLKYLFTVPLYQQVIPNACNDLITAIGHQLDQEATP